MGYDALMPWLYLLLGALLWLLLSALALYWFVRWLRRREPYATFMRLRTKAKLRFFIRLLRHPGVPLWVKLLPLAAVPYLLMPFDPIPDFIPVLGQLDDVAVALATLALVIRLAPRAVVEKLLREAQAEGDPGP